MRLPFGYVFRHNFLGGLGVGRRSSSTCESGSRPGSVAAAHEVPQELGDFGILVHNGWKTRAALAYQRRLRAHLPRRRAGRLRALGLARRRPPAPLTAGNFVYIAAADLVPQITSPVACATPAEHELVLREKLEQTLAFAVGLAAPFVTALLA